MVAVCGRSSAPGNGCNRSHEGIFVYASTSRSAKRNLDVGCFLDRPSINNDGTDDCSVNTDIDDPTRTKTSSRTACCEGTGAASARNRSVLASFYSCTHLPLDARKLHKWRRKR